MLNLSANEAKTNFGEALMKSQRQPVQISKYGKPAAMLISMEDYAELEELKLEILRLRVAQAETQITQNELVNGEDFFNDLLDGKHD